MTRLYEFYQLSSALTGKSNAALRQMDIHLDRYRALTCHVQLSILDELFAAFNDIKRNFTENHVAYFKRHIATCNKFSPIVCSILKLWQTGSWLALPDYWQTAYGQSAVDSQLTKRDAAAATISYSAA